MQHRLSRFTRAQQAHAVREIPRGVFAVARSGFGRRGCVVLGRLHRSLSYKRERAGILQSHDEARFATATVAEYSGRKVEGRSRRR